MKYLPFLLMAALTVGVGCGCGSGQKGAYPPATSSIVGHGGVDWAGGGRPAPAPGQGPEAPRPGDGAANQPPIAGKPAAVPAAGQRKIRYTADMRVIVEDFGRAEKQLMDLVKAQQGYVAQSQVNGSPGAARHGSWKVRIPVDRFDAFREAVAHLGEIDKNNTDSEDVTEEYYDLEARIKNHKSDEESLRKLLEKSAGRMDEIIAVRRELSRVREEIERSQGRLSVLSKLTAMTTATIVLDERQKYVPPRPPEVAEAPTFGMRVGKTFEDSFDLLNRFGQALALITVALAPWLPILAVVLLPVWLLARRRMMHPPVPAVGGAAPTQAPPPGGGVPG